MSITFAVLRQNARGFDRAPLSPDDLDLSLSNDNAYDVLAALGIENSYSSSPWPIARFRSLLTVARRNLGHRSPAIPTTEQSETSNDRYRMRPAGTNQRSIAQACGVNRKG